MIKKEDNKIGKYISPQRGKSLLSKDAIKGNVPVVAGGISCSTYHNKANTTSPVITISASGANAGYINLWHIPVWSSDSSFIDDSISPDIYFWYVVLKKRQKEIFDIQTGSAQPHIYPQHIEIIPICELDFSVVRIYNEQVTPLFEYISANLKITENLVKLRDTLLPKLMSGEVDVSTVDVSSLNYHLVKIILTIFTKNFVSIFDIIFNYHERVMIIKSEINYEKFFIYFRITIYKFIITNNCFCRPCSY